MSRTERTDRVTFRRMCAFVAAWSIALLTIALVGASV